MQFKFDSNQEYQLHAIDSVVDLFEGQPRITNNPTFTFGSIAAVPNQLFLPEDEILSNLNEVQREQNIATDSALQCIEEEIEGAGGKRTARFMNFSVEMETGTGKTYVYLRTALKLHERYGFRKFIVVVPSVPIREGVLKSFAMTEKHFKELFGNVAYRYTSYDSDNPNLVRQFALSNSVEFMVMTIDSFNKASNVIRQSTDKLQGETPIHLVQATRPILILDEPQNMESELRIKALAALDPLFALRYSATHRNPYNLVYRLTPFEAYRQGLVKKITVAGVEEQNESAVFLRLNGIKTQKKTITASIAVHKLMADGTVKEQNVTVKSGDELSVKANRPEYEPFIVQEINAVDGFVRFGNGIELKAGEERGANKKAIFNAQIRFTIEEHFRKQRRLKEAGVKVLSLFFIDRVDNYVKDDGLIRQLFTDAFNDLKQQYAEWKDVEVAKVQEAYFASRRTKSGEVIYEDSKTGESEKDKAAYDLIMKDKERLLSFEEPVCFIFSHSALREGWDNPNIFQICTLNQTVSETKKRQEIGRGMRLSVNQHGDRVRDDKVNVLTVVPNESYQRYVESYQSEIEEDFGKEGAPPPPADRRKQKTVRLRKEYLLKSEFKELWERIKHKTRYAVKVDSRKLIEDVLEDLKKAEIKRPRIMINRAKMTVDSTGKQFTTLVAGDIALPMTSRGTPVPNVIEVMANLMEHTTPPMRVTRTTLLEIFKRCNHQEAAIQNPYDFAHVAVHHIKLRLADQLVDGIVYEKIDEYYEMTQFETELELFEQHLIPSIRPDGSNGAALYDYVEYESETEKIFAEEMEKDERVKFYVKLPKWFVVDTPIAKYTPDWAVVIEKSNAHGEVEDTLYLVRETKSTTDKSKLRPDETKKIHCGEVHFTKALDVNYKVISDINEIF
ncbi:MAG: DEAD/DEAH box helicase family protein [Bacteroidota bacterium]